MELLEYLGEYAVHGYTYGYGDGVDGLNGNGDGSGDGDGRGNGNGDGNGYGFGKCCWNLNDLTLADCTVYGGDGSGGRCGGDGRGYGDGFGDGYSYAHGITEFNGVKRYDVDGVPTFLESVKHNIGKGFSIKHNTVKVPCYVYLTDDGFIAHGNTLHAAMEAATEKSLQCKPLNQRLREFVAAHPDIDAEYGDLFKWHHILTGSCEFGRKQWCEAHGLNPTDRITVRQFISMTRGEYGGDVIRQLDTMYGGQ